MRRVRSIGTAAGICAAALASAFACGSEETVRAGAGGAAAAPFVDEASATGLKIALIGVDGATFDVLEPLVEAGALPEFERLLEIGAHAPLRSLESTVSPAVWTTIATGQLPAQHGIDDFNVPVGEAGRMQLVSTGHRKRLALWNMAGPFGRSVGVIGWWVTWPAEPVRGFVVSDRVAHSRHQSWADGKQYTHLTYPPELYDELHALVIDPDHPPLDEMLEIAPLRPSEIEEMRSVKRPVLFHWLSVFQSGYSEQRSYEKIAFELLKRRQPDLFLLLLIANDPISHTFWHFYEPDAFPGGVDPERAARLGAVIPNVYRHNDRTLARLRERLDPDTVLFVVSDHGFGASGRLPQPSAWVGFKAGERSRVARPLNVGQSGSHRRDGVLIAAGGPIRPGAVPGTTPTVLDIAPTLLALLGLPVARDMPGRVLEELIDPAFLAAHPIRRIDSYETRIDIEPIVDAAEATGEPRLEYLRALGYIE
ncbi:MAG: alkaline phosphatase family protein [Deltaproteobacteria bacterium]|nr:MAG: alkaline phosphatase family protein [Deltaproteobacteria bacterium]